MFDLNWLALPQLSAENGTQMPDSYPLSFVSLARGPVAHQGSIMKCRVEPTVASRGVTFCTRETGGGAITGGGTKKIRQSAIPRKDLLELGNLKGRYPGIWGSTGNFSDLQDPLIR